MSQQPKTSKGTRVAVKGSNARFGLVVESHTTQANTGLVLMDGSRNPNVFAASSLAIAEGGVGCSPGSRAARAPWQMTGPVTLRRITWTGTKKLKTRPPPPKVTSAKTTPAKTRSQRPRTAVTNTSHLEAV